MFQGVAAQVRHTGAPGPLQVPPEAQNGAEMDQNGSQMEPQMAPWSRNFDNLCFS